MFPYSSPENRGLTQYGKNNIKHLIPILDRLILDFKKKNNQSIEQYFFKKYEHMQKKYQVFIGIPTRKSIPANISEFQYGGVMEFRDFAIDLFRKAENILRFKRGIPKIGEGWISETNLYYELKDHFSNCTVLHNFSPKWFGKQHLDIYFLEYKIAIEYQGIQHQKPIDYFGGEEGFEKTKERDNKKKNLCEKNGVKLLYAYENDDLNTLIRKISDIINSNKNINVK